MKTNKFEKSSVTLSVVIPAYKSERFIEKSLTKVYSVLNEGRYAFELICVVDGKVDGTYKKARKIARSLPNLRVLGYKSNKGKGYAVRYGMSRANGKIVGFIDAGVELNINGMAMVLEHFEWYKADIIVGSKRHPASKVIYPWQRTIMSVCYQILVKILFGLNLRDTQVGMKFFRKEVLEKTLPRLLVKKFAFDIEMLAVANYLGFTRIYEAPVALKMKFNGESTIVSKKFFNVVFYMVWDTIAVFYRLRILHYYDYKNRKAWESNDIQVLAKTE